MWTSRGPMVIWCEAFSVLAKCLQTPTSIRMIQGYGSCLVQRVRWSLLALQFSTGCLRRLVNSMKGRPTESFSFVWSLSRHELATSLSKCGQNKTAIFRTWLLQANGTDAWTRRILKSCHEVVVLIIVSLVGKKGTRIVPRQCPFQRNSHAQTDRLPPLQLDLLEDSSEPFVPLESTADEDDHENQQGMIAEIAH